MTTTRRRATGTTQGGKMTEEALPVAVSYSTGTSSEWLIEAVIQGVIPRPDRFAVFFADTGGEHEWSYEAGAQVEERCKREGIPFFRCSHSKESLTDHLLSLGSGGEPFSRRADHPPLWVAKDGGGRGRIEHRCTREFKVQPMRRAQSEWLKSEGLPKKITKWVGFANDESHRAIKATGKQDVQWERLDFPAIRLGVGRGQQREQLTKWTGRAPRFSMCKYCPFKGPDRWLKTSDKDLKESFSVDEAIRDLECIGVTDGPAYLTDRLIPVEQLIRKGDPQPTLPGLESYCDGGACFL